MLRRNWLPLTAVMVAAVVSLLLGFNGLYGQDAHEYVRLSRAYFQQMQGMPYLPEGRGDAAFAVGYPLAGALLRFGGPGSILALQLVSWCSAGAALYAFDVNLRVLSPGAHRWSRQLYAGIALGLSAYFVRAGLTVMSDALGLALTLAAFHYGMRAVEGRRGRDAVWAAVFSGLAVLTRFSLAPLVGPLALGVAIALLRVPAFTRRHDWNVGWLGLALLAGSLVLAPHFLLKMKVPGTPLDHSLLQDWSPLNLFRAKFSSLNGTVDYGWPNLLYVLFPLFHPGFLLPLPLLFFLAKRTDFLLPAKRVLLVCVAVYLFFLGGVPHQNLRYLLPAFALLLLLLFPAWDRFVSYGFYFFKKLTWTLLLLGVTCQVFFAVKTMMPVLARNRLERGVAERVREVVERDRGSLRTSGAGPTPGPSLRGPSPSPSGEGSLPSDKPAPLPGAGAGACLEAQPNPQPSIYAFDLDIALKTYLPEVQWLNLWERRYQDFPPGSYILFNEPRLRSQWQGRNPMLNWDFAVQHFELRECARIPEGWTLYVVVKAK